MRISVLIFFAVALNGCATQSSMEPPIVDQRGHDPVKFANDQAACIQRGNAFVTVGAPVTACMRERGYVILVPKR